MNVRSTAMHAAPVNCCRLCGSTNYRRIFARDDGGVLRHTGRYECSGCQLSFAHPAEWQLNAQTPRIAGITTAPTRLSAP